MPLAEIGREKSVALQRRLLNGVEGVPFCEHCQDMPNRVLPEDVLDEAADQLKAIYDVKMKGVLS